MKNLYCLGLGGAGFSLWGLYLQALKSTGWKPAPMKHFLRFGFLILDFPSRWPIPIRFLRPLGVPAVGPPLFVVECGSVPPIQKLESGSSWRRYACAQDVCVAAAGAIRCRHRGQGQQGHRRTLRIWHRRSRQLPRASPRERPVVRVGKDGSMIRFAPERMGSPAWSWARTGCATTRTTWNYSAMMNHTPPPKIKWDSPT